MLLARLCLLPIVSQAAAVPDGPAVQWSAPGGCPDRETMLATVARRLGRPLADEATIDARIVGAPGRGYTLHLRLAAGTRGETREVHDPSCEALTEAAALRVVVLLESAPVVPPPPSETEPAPAPDVASTPAQPAADPPVTPAAPRASEPPSAPVPENMPRGPGVLLRLHGGGEVGAVGGPTGAGGLVVGLLWPRVRLELQGTVLAPRTTSAATGGAVRAGLYSGALHGCGRLGRGALEVPLCGGLELGALPGEVRGLPGARGAAAWWFAAVIAPGLAWHVARRVSVWASLQLVLAAVRPQFVQGEGAAAREIFDPSLASGRLLVGVELRLRDRW